MAQKIFLSVAIFLSFGLPARSQTVLTCEIFDGYIPVGETYPIDFDPGYIAGEVPGSRVNVRTGPGTEYEANAYGLVGDAIQVRGQAFSKSCETWVQVQFPVSGHIGWVHSDFISLHYGRGWWD